MKTFAFSKARMWSLILVSASLLSRATADQSSNSLNAIDQTVRSVTLQADGKILIAGDFTMVEGALRGHVARLNADGSTDFSFMKGLSGASGPVLSTGVQSDTHILIGGEFLTVNGIARAGVARLNTNGVLDMSFNAATGSAPFLLVSGGELVAATALLTVNGTKDNLFRLNSNGSVDSGWTTTLNGGTAQAMVRQPDDKLIVVGTFAQVNGLNRAGLARLNTNGTTDITFQNGMTGAPGIVDAVALQPDGKAVIGGYFSQVNGAPRVRLARLNTDGSTDTGFLNGMAGADGEIESIVIQPDGKILIAGAFSMINTSRRAGIARLNTDGSVDDTFQNGMAGANGIVWAVALQPDGRVVMGGTFTAVDGVARYYVARLNTDGSLDSAFHNGGPPAPTLSNPAIHSNHFEFLINGQSNQVVVIEATTNFLSWHALATNRLGTNPASFSDPGPLNLNRRFYRARLQ